MNIVGETTVKLQYKKQQDYDKIIKLDENNCLRYYSKKAIKNKYPKGGYKVLGGIGKGLKESIGKFVYKENNIQKHYQIYDYYNLKYQKWRYRIDGYIEVGEKTYLAVTKDRLVQQLFCISLSLLVFIIIVFSLLQLVDSRLKLDSSAKDYTPSNIELSDTDPNYIALPGYDRIFVNAGDNCSYVALWNPPQNPCYFQFTITLKDDGKEIYKSGLIEPGKAITEIKWNRRFIKGIYDIEINIRCYSLIDRKSELNGGVILSKLIVLEKE